MPEITFDQAKNFLESITSEDKVAIIHHDDGDGFCSGILYYDWCKQKNAETEQFTYKIRRSSLKDFNLDKFNKIIVCDLAPDFMAEELELIRDKKVLYTDHHPREIPVPKEILELVTTDQGYIPSSRTAGELTGLKPWLSLIGTVTDAGDLYPENQDFINERLKQIKMTLEEFKQNITSVVTNFLVYFEKDLNKAFEILQKISSIEEIKNLKQYSEPVEDEVQKFVDGYESKKEKLGDVNYYYFEPHFSVKLPVSGIISQKNNDDAYIFASPKNNGENISFSARNTSQKINMADLLRTGVEGLEDGNAGGHAPAAGGMILAKDIDKFKENIRNYLAGPKKS